MDRIGQTPKMQGAPFASSPRIPALARTVKPNIIFGITIKNPIPVTTVYMVTWKSMA